jgi:hypothetical protein
MNKRTCIKYLLSKSIQPTVDMKEFAMRREIEMKEIHLLNQVNLQYKVLQKEVHSLSIVPKVDNLT